MNSVLHRTCLARTIDSPTNSARSKSPAASRGRRQGACCFRPAARQCFARRRSIPKCPSGWPARAAGGSRPNTTCSLRAPALARAAIATGKLDGRTTEIQRLIGRSLRAIVDLDALGERSMLIDCDVLEADGGTRTASITGAFIAMVDALATFDQSGILDGLARPHWHRRRHQRRPRRRPSAARSRLLAKTLPPRSI